jgi:tetratricopeptide (TPR) repeat protein
MSIVATPCPPFSRSAAATGSFGRALCLGAAMLVSTGLLGRVSSAQVTVQTLIGRAVTDDTHNTEINNAITRFRDRDVEGCRALLERVHSEDPKVPPPGVMMATLWLGVKQVPAARAELDKTAARFPDDPEAFLVLADLAFQDRRVTDAAVLFDRATLLTDKFSGNAKRKRDFDIRCNAGEAAVAEARGNWEQALQRIQEWVKIDPDSSSAQQRLGGALYRLDRSEEALAAFREARKLDESLLQPELLLARLYDQDKKVDKARELVDAAVKIAADDVNVRIGAASWFLNHGDTVAASENAQAGLQLDPKSLEAKLINGTVARVKRDFDTAEKFFSEAHTQSPRNFPAADSLALVLAESADKDKLQQALELAETNMAMVKDNQPLELTSATTLAWVYYKLGRVADAEKILAQVAQNNALTADGAYYIARILNDKGETEQARRLLDQVMSNEPMFANRAAAEQLIESIRGAGDQPGQ